jgi:hypothetical protein
MNGQGLAADLGADPAGNGPRPSAGISKWPDSVGLKTGSRKGARFP